MKFKPGDRVYCTADDTYWTIGGYTEDGRVWLKEQEFYKSRGWSYPEEWFRLLTPLEKLL